MKSAALIFVVACFIAGYSASCLSIPLLFCAVLFCTFLFFKKEKLLKTIIISAVTCTLAVMYFNFYIEYTAAKADKYIADFNGSISGTVLNDIQIYDDESRFIIKTPCGNKISITYKSIKEVYPGDIIEINDAEIQKISHNNRLKNRNAGLIGKNCLLSTEADGENLNITGFNKLYAISNYAYKMKKSSFNSLLKYMNYDEAATAYAMFTSDKTPVSGEIYDALIKTGTIHIATVSGYHFSFLGMLVMALLKFFVKRYRPRAVWLIIVMSVFAFYTGMSVPVLRAYIFFAVFNVNNLFYIKRFDNKNLFLILMVIFLVISPVLVFDASFILTFIATAVIIYLCPHGNAFVSQFKKKGNDSFDVTSLVVTLAMMPVVFCLFGRISVVSFFANLSVEITAGIILFLTGAVSLVSTVIPPLAALLAFILKFFIRYFLFAVKTFSHIENINPQIPLDIISAFFIVAVLVSALCLIFKRNLKALSVFITSLTALILCISSLLYEPQAYVTFLNNKTCTGTVITKNSHHAVIASTEDFYYYCRTSALKYNETVDFWVVTEEPDLEKIEELKKIYNIKEIIVPEKFMTDEIYDVTALSENISRNLKDVEVSIQERYTKLLCVRAVYGKSVLYISDNPDFVFDEMPDIKDSSIIFIRGYPLVLDDAEMGEGTKLYSAVPYNPETNLITPYSIGIMDATKCSFQ